MLIEKQQKETEDRRESRSGERVKGRTGKYKRLIDDRARLAIASPPPRMEDKFIRRQWNAAEASRKKSTQHDVVAFPV